jgi:transposase InsO family protein
MQRKVFSAEFKAKVSLEALAGRKTIYNHQRPHQALGYRTPAEVYADRAIILSPKNLETLT